MFRFATRPVLSSLRSSEQVSSIPPFSGDFLRKVAAFLCLPRTLPPIDIHGDLSSLLSMLRSVCPEILDTLAASNPDAQASRRDLRRINQLMGNSRWLERRLSSKQRHDEMHLVEIGAGDGTLAKRLLGSITPSTYTAVDLAPQPEDWPKYGTWLQTDLLTIDYAPNATHLIASLMLHHFEAPALKVIGERIQNSQIRTILACEPSRRPIHQAQLKAGKLIGFNHVTLHDGVVSVRAGFRANELPIALNLGSDKWNYTIQETFMGAYRMIATRK